MFIFALKFELSLANNENGKKMKKIERKKTTNKNKKKQAVAEMCQAQVNFKLDSDF